MIYSVIGSKVKRGADSHAKEIWNIPEVVKWIMMFLK